MDDKDYDPSDFSKALEKSLQLEEKIPIGILYKKAFPTYTDNIPQLKKGTLAELGLKIDLGKFISDFT